MRTFDRATAKRLMATRMRTVVSSDRLESLMAQSPQALVAGRPSRSVDAKRLAAMTDPTTHPRAKRTIR